MSHEFAHVHTKIDEKGNLLVMVIDFGDTFFTDFFDTLCLCTWCCTA